MHLLKKFSKEIHRTYFQAQHLEKKSRKQLNLLWRTLETFHDSFTEQDEIQ